MDAKDSGLCFGCYDNLTFQYHGYNAEMYQSEIKRYTSSIYDGMTVKCSLCERIAVFERNKKTGKWLQYYEEVVE